MLTTGIGSLPHGDFEQALAHVLAHYDVPFYPQLPTRAAGAASPLMMHEVLPGAKAGMELLEQLQGEPGIRGFYGLEEFLQRTRGRERVKMQLAGPMTLAAWLAVDNPELPREGLTELCWQWIEKLTRKLAAMLPAGAWLMWDDGLLARAGDAARFHALRAGLKVRLGLHTCTDGAAVPLLERFRGALVALDMSVVDCDGAEAAFAAHAAAGGAVIFGAFDTRFANLDVPAGLMRARRAASLAGAAGISGGCGTGLKPLAYEELLAGGLKMAKALGGLSPR
jgi:hypothetical protein